MLNWLLRPFSWLYGGITDVRNRLYDKGVKQVYIPPVRTISVGNLTVGGTGKTPHVDYLLRRLKRSYPVATLSRGYGRQTKGFRVATPSDTADTIGDEPLLLYRKHGPGVVVAVGEKRAEAIPQLLALANPPSAKIHTIILDDAFQHRPVQPHLNILLTDYNRLFYKDHPFPAGRLRERRNGAKRADALIVTKCPDNLSTSEMVRISESLKPFVRGNIPVFFTGLRYGKPVSFAGISIDALPNELVLVSGIARPEPLEHYVQQHFNRVRHLRFADHHRYVAKDLETIQAALPPDGVVLTTEKDFVKLQPLLAKIGGDVSRFYYLPIDVAFLTGEPEFLALLDKEMC
ncbi:tetraacyldisaccharide 4'-kinase [Tellurirhabdus bombi]|uniref:tetraacyldisaccharide 4'-kinase n=1 Tax=Tellurirhabdus bombi TaxID=2907205 RepID=UPI00286E732D|nr:tetraacyldisaccharide 4'-kinase [Tellurirhabdus bombi]